MIFDATVGGESSNSFITLAEAVDIAPVVLTSSDYPTFNLASSDDQQLSLMRATRMLDRAFEWSGSKYRSSQNLSWPRSGVIIDGDDVGFFEIPRPVADATVLLACRLLGGFTPSSGLGSQPSRVKVGPIDITLQENKLAPRAGLPEDVLALLESVGSYQGPMSGAKVVQLVRT